MSQGGTISAWATGVAVVACLLSVTGCASKAAGDAASDQPSATPGFDVAGATHDRVRYPRPGRGELPGTVRVTAVGQGVDILTATPDGRAIVAQMREANQSVWTRPQQVATAPSSMRCFDLAPTPNPAGAPFYVTLRCWAGSIDGQRYASVTAVTEDAVTWVSVTGTDDPIRVGDSLLFRGHPAFIWTPADGTQQVGLPIQDNEEVTLLEDGTWILTSATPTSRGCQFEVRVASADAREWSEPIANDMPYLPPKETCVPPRPQYEGKLAYVYLDTLGPQYQPALIARADGAWRVRAPQLAG